MGYRKNMTIEQIYSNIVQDKLMNKDINWNDIITYQKLNYEFIIDNIQNLLENKIFMYYKFDNDLLQNVFKYLEDNEFLKDINIDINSSSLSNNIFYQICSYQMITLDFIENYLLKYIINTNVKIHMFDPLDKQILEKYSNLISFGRLCGNKDITLDNDFIIKHIDKIDWWTYLHNHTVNDEFLQKFKLPIFKYGTSILSNINFPEWFLKEFIEYIKIKSPNSYEVRYIVLDIIKHQKVTLNFIKEINEQYTNQDFDLDKNDIKYINLLINNEIYYIVDFKINRMVIQNEKRKLILLKRKGIWIVKEKQFSFGEYIYIIGKDMQLDSSINNEDVVNSVKQLYDNFLNEIKNLSMEKYSAIIKQSNDLKIIIDKL
jgi:hypothetical protein